LKESVRMSLPKLTFSTCDETSLKLGWDVGTVQEFAKGGNFTLKILYKEPHVEWEKADSVEIRSLNSSEVTLKEADIIDLKPGTPYCVRLAAVNNDDGSITYGPDTVFDTRPIDCSSKGKKKKNCTIS
jgi:hypothetical protein